MTRLRRLYCFAVGQHSPCRWTRWNGSFHVGCCSRCGKLLAIVAERERETA